MKIELLYDCGVEMRHRTGLTASDPFIYIRKENGEELVYLDSREYVPQKEKLQEMNSTIKIEAIEPHALRDREKNRKHGTLLEVLDAIGAEEIVVSENLPYVVALSLIHSGRKVTTKDLTSERSVKTEREIALMKKAQHVTEKCYRRVQDILEKSAIIGKHIRWDGKVLTSELLKSEIKILLLKHGYSCPQSLIVASGEQTAYSHNEGTGNIIPNSFIIVDIFPRNDENGYFADMTRTFCKGKPSDEMRRMYEATLAVQETALENAKVGVVARDLQHAACKQFETLGFHAGSEKGFSHGLGHGLGLEVHEGPSTRQSVKLEAGNVITIEPGLYYPGIGGCRLEDVIVLHKDSTENITKFDKKHWIIP